MADTMIVTTLAAGQSGRKRLLSALARGESIPGVFFFSDGVEAAAAAEERNAWQALAERHRVLLWLCSDSCQRRGFDVSSQAPAGFRYAGVERFAELAAQVDRIDVAGRT